STVRSRLIKKGLHKVRHRHLREGKATCRQCGREQSSDEFPALAVGKYRCRECLADYLHTYQLRKLRLGTLQYQSLLEKQGGRCAICGTAQGHRSCRGRACHLAVDHDHQTGTVRGLLCNKCNRGLGWFQDSPEILETAARYLKREQQGGEKADHTHNC